MATDSNRRKSNRVKPSLKEKENISQRYELADVVTSGVCASKAENKRATHQEPRKFIKEGGLLAHDWATIAEYAALLKPFKEATTCLQGRGLSGSHGAIWEVLIIFKWLLTDLENQKTRLIAINYNDPDAPEDHLITNVNAAHKKLSDYYTKLDDSPICYAATVLHPTYKHLLEDLWKVPEDYDEQKDGPHPY